MKDIKKMKKKELIDEYKSICQMIDDICCFGVKDVMYRELLEREIERRGLKIYNRIEVN